MTNEEKLKDKILGTMKLLADDKEWPIAFPLIEKLVDSAVNDWHKDIDDQLTVLIKDWESRMGDKDTTLYSLGVRRAQDIVRGESSDL
jgi:hypothetical protein